MYEDVIDLATHKLNPRFLLMFNGLLIIGAISKDCSQQPISLCLSNISSNSVTLHLSNFSDSEITEQLNLSFPGTSVVELTITNGPVKRVTKDLLKGLPSLKRVSISRTSLVSIPSNFFFNANEVEFINLSENNFTGVTGFMNSTRTLAKLRKLDFSNNGMISELRSNFLEGKLIQSLDVVKMTHCNVTKISRGAFSNLINLRYLDVSGNPINEEALFNLTLSLVNSHLKTFKAAKLRLERTEFPAKALNNLAGTNLTHLDMSGNVFLKLGDGFISEMITLEQLNLSSCGIHYVGGLSFQGLSELRELYLNENKIFRLRGSLLLTPKLTRLELDSNENEVQNSNAKLRVLVKDLKALSYLTHLKINSNSQPRISQALFSELHRLERLEINDCQIRELDNYAFSNLTNLKTLELNHNNLRNLPDSAFYGLISLESLSLNENEIKFFENNAPFAHLWRLESLEMQGNLIKEIPASIFIHLTNLSSLLMSRNNIINWEYEILPENIYLATLSLESNGISVIYSAMLRDFYKVVELDISDNPFQCQACQNVDFLHFLNNSETKLLSSNSTQCVEDRTLLADVDLAETMSHCETLISSMTLQISLSISCTVLGLLGFALFIYYRRYDQWYSRLTVGLYRVEKRIRQFRGQLVDEKKYLYDAFVSYSVCDEEWVITELVAHTEVAVEHQDECFKLCLHQRDFQGGLLISENISCAMATSRAVIIVLTEEYINSQWCMFELDSAVTSSLRHSYKQIIVVQLKEVPRHLLPKRVKYLSKTRTYLSWTENSATQTLFWKRLRDSLKKNSQ